MRYRIVRDAYLGYEVQAWRWWFPIWLQCGFSNTNISLERAKERIERERRAREVVWTE